MVGKTLRGTRGTFLGMTLTALVVSGCSTVTPFGRPSSIVNSETSFNGGRALRSFPMGDANRLISPVKNAMGDVGIHSVTQMAEGDRILLEGKAADNRRTTVWISPRGGTSQVAVRVGLFGDEPLSRALVDRVAIRLGTPANPTDPTVSKAALNGEEKDAPPIKESTPRISKDAVSDETMLRDAIPSGYRESPVP